MKFCWCTITVKSMEESVRFYEEIVGLPVQSRLQLGAEREIAFLGEGETKVELVWDQNAAAPGVLQGISMGFEVASVDAMIEFIKEKGLEVEKGPFEPTPHIRFFYVKDPNGLSIQFVEHKK